MEATNPEVFRTRPSKDVAVTIVINVDKNASDAMIAENAAEALRFYSNGLKNKGLSKWKSWAIKISTKTLTVRT